MNPADPSSVVIAGGGPVGLTLALVLAHHGVGSTLLERSETPTQHPKMDLTNGRTMELFRSIGIADAVRAVGVPEDQPLDVVWATSLPGHELFRCSYPSPAEQRRRARLANDGTDTTEPRLRVSQILVEPLLRSLVRAEPLVDDRIGWTVTGVDQSLEEGVTVTAQDPAGAERQVRGRYLAGCDGGSSTVRRAVGIALEGEFSVFRVCTHHFRSTARDVLTPFGPTYHVQVPLGTLIAQDGNNTWTIHGGLPKGFDEAGTDAATLLRRRLGRDVPLELLVESYWSPHLAVADRYRAGRVFLAGDAAHVFIPTGGYGMNTGVADAFDLGWKLAAVITGWGGPSLLDSYDAERRPVALRNLRAAQHHSLVRSKVAKAYRHAAREGDLDGVDDDAAERRRRLGGEIAALYDGEYEAWGVEYGYRYASSPVVLEETPAGEPPAWRSYDPTTIPGARLPALYLEDGTALHDLVGPHLTLFVRDGADPSALAGAARATGIPLDVRRLPSGSSALDLLERRLVLVRPDHHVAWRGDDEPGDGPAVLRRVTGWSSADQTIS